MTEILENASKVATPLGLIRLIAALGFYARSRWLKSEERRLEALPPEERAAAIDERLTRYHILAGDLSKAKRVQLIADEMEKRFRLARFNAALLAAVFVLCFITAAAAYAIQRYWPPQADSHPSDQQLPAREQKLLLTMIDDP